jgi:DNA repair exonuclease SbcCD ATPase subunit
MAYESPDFDTADFLLKRNWFVDIQSIHDLLRRTSNEVFWQIFHNRHEYVQRVREVIAPNDYIPDRALLKMKVSDLTDEHLAIIAKKRRDQIKALMKSEWEEHMRKHNPLRPRNDDIDKRIAAQDAEVADAQKKLAEYTEKRKNGDKLALKRFDKMISDLKAQMPDLETQRLKMDARWLEHEELNFHEQMLSMQNEDPSHNQV